MFTVKKWKNKGAGNRPSFLVYELVKANSGGPWTDVLARIPARKTPYAIFLLLLAALYGATKSRNPGNREAGQQGAVFESSIADGSCVLRKSDGDGRGVAAGNGEVAYVFAFVSLETEQGVVRIAKSLAGLG